MFTGTVNLAKDYYITNVNALQKKIQVFNFLHQFFPEYALSRSWKNYSRMNAQ